jgi:lysophospholipase L1-like esterase
VRRLQGFLAIGAALLLGGASPEYVAMGSSFAAGPGIGERAEGSPRSCRQSASNYAHLLARRRGLSLQDVTCSGATTQTVLHANAEGVPAQIEAVGPETRLVTVTVGGNDVFYMRNLWAWSCGGDPAAVPGPLRGFVCSAAPPEQVAQAFEGLETNMLEIANQVHARAPAAKLVFVDYLTVLPDTGSCAQAPMTAAQYQAARGVARRLLAITHKVAAEAHALTVSAALLTRGHDVCAADPWITGFAFTPGAQGFGTLPYHPTQPSMDAVAAALDETLEPDAN